MNKCFFCKGNVIDHKCLYCGRSDDLDYEFYVMGESRRLNGEDHLQIYGGEKGHLMRRRRFGFEKGEKIIKPPKPISCEQDPNNQ